MTQSFSPCNAAATRVNTISRHTIHNITIHNITNHNSQQHQTFSPCNVAASRVNSVARDAISQYHYSQYHDLSAPAMLLPHESTVSHETQQEKGVLTARQLTAAQEITNGGSKVKSGNFIFAILSWHIVSLVSKLQDKDHNVRS